MITTSTTNEVKEIMKCEIEWLDIKKNEFYFFMDYLVTDGDNIEIKWFDGDDWDSWSERNSNINNEDITHFAELPYI